MVTWLFNKGELSALNNYRPISIISIIATKVFERIVYDQLYNFYQITYLNFYISKLGFCSLHSTVGALLGATDDWAFNINCSNINAVVFIDVKKSIHTVDHDILLSKMNLYRIQGMALDWFKSYSTNHTQQCCVNGSLSRICSLKCRVLQGTMQVPFYFLFTSTTLQTA